MNRLRTPDVIAGAGGLVLLVALILPWYSIGPIEVNGFEAFGFVDLVLVVTGLMGVSLPIVTALRDSPALPIAIDVLTTWVAGLALLLLLFRTLNTPGPDGVVRELGLWVGVLGTVGVLAGAYLAMRDQAAPGLRPNPEPRRMPAP